MIPKDAVTCILPSRTGVMGQAATAHAFHAAFLKETTLCRPDEWLRRSREEEEDGVETFTVLSMGTSHLEDLWSSDNLGGTSHLVMLDTKDLDTTTNDAFPLVHQDVALLPDVGPYEQNVDVLEEYIMCWSWNKCRQVLLARERADLLTLLISDRGEPTGAKLSLAITPKTSHDPTGPPGPPEAC